MAVSPAELLHRALESGAGLEGLLHLGDSTLQAGILGLQDTHLGFNIALKAL